SRRPVAFTATTPVDTDHAHAPRKQRRGQLDPLLASEVAMDEDDGDVALTPCAPSEMDLARPHPRHDSPLLVQPHGRRGCRRHLFHWNGRRGRAIDQMINRYRRIGVDTPRSHKVD